MYFETEDTVLEMNKLGHEKCPFLFVIGYDTNRHIVMPLASNDEANLCWSIADDDFLQICNTETSANPIAYTTEPIAFQKFEHAFNQVHKQLFEGNSFLCNLTASTSLYSQNTLKEFYLAAKAKYKLWVKDTFTCFSPEAFIKINTEGIVSSFPMKGTINASLPNAKEVILNNQKEHFEHTTIVDLIRNDLSKICSKVWVERFRYFDSIRKSDGEILLQVSSEVKGQLDTNWTSNIGSLLFDLLPAGSITGAPKTKTTQIIQEAEKELHTNGKRNYYTGVFGIFDGEKLSSSVMIRFIEQDSHGNKVYKSGGGITFLSNAADEYEELKQKIYVPIF